MVGVPKNTSKSINIGYRVSSLSVIASPAGPVKVASRGYKDIQLRKPNLNTFTSTSCDDIAPTFLIYHQSTALLMSYHPSDLFSSPHH